MNTNVELKALGIKLKSFRESKELTQSKLAHKIGKDRESISRLERGLTNPTYLFLREVCNGLEITLKDLFNNCEM